MSEYVIQCARFAPCEADSTSLHVRAVATGQWPVYRRIWSMAELCAAMAGGDRFYIQSQDRAVRAQLEYRICPACQMAETIDTQDPIATLKIRDLPVLQ